jgi:anti-anti-sigma factor
MQISFVIADKVARLSLGGRFDFSAHRDFRERTEQLLQHAGVETVDIDLGAVTYLDSSALGMLLMLRDKAKAAEREIRLSNCSVPVRQVLDVANFQKLFQID